MKFHNEFRDGKTLQEYVSATAKIVTQPWTIIEIGGGEEDVFITSLIEELLPPQINIIHGLGYNLCVTPTETIDQAIQLASQANIILACFENILTVPGTEKNLLSIKFEGKNVILVNTPLDCLKIAQANPHKEVVFLASGFENTVPASAMAAYQAVEKKIKNFSVLVSHLLIPPAIENILSNPECPTLGFLGPSNIDTVLGYKYYQAIAKKYNVPIVVTGFEPVDIMQGIYMCIQQLESGKGEWQNQDHNSWHTQTNPITQKLIEEVFEVVDRDWRHLGNIPKSGFALREKYLCYDAQNRFKSLFKKSIKKNSPLKNSIMSAKVSSSTTNVA